MTTMQASNEKPRLPSWVRIAVFLFAVLLILLIYSMGSIWVGHIVFFLAALAATWLLEPNLRPLARTVVVLVSMTLVLTTAFVQLLNSLMQTGVIQQNTLLHSFLGRPEIRLLVSLMLINQLPRGIQQAQQVNLDPKVIERFAHVVEQLSSNLVHDDLTAPRYVEALEKIAASETTKTIALGSTMLDPGVRALPRRRGSGQD